MKRKSSDRHLLFLAATRHKGPKSLRRIMKGRAATMAKRMLGGTTMPEDRKERALYLRGVSCISEKILSDQTGSLVDCIRRRKPRLVLKEEVSRLSQRLKALQKILWICEQSSMQARYAQFLGRPDFDIPAFLEAMKLYSAERDVDFQKLPETKKRARKKLLRLVSGKSERDVARIAGFLGDNLSGLNDSPGRAYEIAAVLTGKRKVARGLLKLEMPDQYSLLKDKREDEGHPTVLFSRCKITPEVKSIHLRVLSEVGIYVDPVEGGLFQFDESFNINGIHGYIAKDRVGLFKIGLEGFAVDNGMLVASRSAVQHELQHIFDNYVLLDEEKGDDWEWEYRAYLSELVFSEERMKLAASLGKCDSEEYSEDEPNDKAQLKIAGLLKECGPKGERDVIEFAKRLLNDAYKKACGLTYDQILEPFRKIKGWGHT